VSPGAIGFGDVLRRWASRLQRRRSEKQLRLRETLQLGERRFVAVVEYEELRFLIAGTPTSVSLLSQLPGSLPNSAPPPPLQFSVRERL